MGGLIRIKILNVKVDLTWFFLSIKMETHTGLKESTTDSKLIMEATQLRVSSLTHA